MKENNNEVISKIRSTILHFKREFFDHAFSSEILHKLWNFEWKIDTIKMLNGDIKKIDDWQRKIESANDLKILPIELIDFIKGEISKAEGLILGGRNIFKEKITLENLRKMVEEVSSIKIDLSTECGHLLSENNKSINLEN